jgi:hypothetical protein
MDLFIRSFVDRRIALKEVSQSGGALSIEQHRQFLVGRLRDIAESAESAGQNAARALQSRPPLRKSVLNAHLMSERSSPRSCCITLPGDRADTGICSRQDMYF